MGYFLADLADVVIGLLLDPWLDTWFIKWRPDFITAEAGERESPQRGYTGFLPSCTGHKKWDSFLCLSFLKNYIIIVKQSNFMIGEFFV